MIPRDCRPVDVHGVLLPQAHPAEGGQPHLLAALVTNEEEHRGCLVHLDRYLELVLGPRQARHDGNYQVLGAHGVLEIGPLLALAPRLPVQHEVAAIVDLPGQHLDVQIHGHVVGDDGGHGVRHPDDAGQPLLLNTVDEVEEDGVGHVVEAQQVFAVGLEAQALLVLVLHDVLVGAGEGRPGGEVLVEVSGDAGADTAGGVMLLLLLLLWAVSPEANGRL